MTIIDDGSTDNTVQVIEQFLANYHGSHHIHFSRRSNKGVTRTLNDLVSASHGEFLLFIHSDDYLLPGGITARLDYLQRHPEKLAVFADCRVVDQTGQQLHASGLTGLYYANIKRLLTPAGLQREIISNWSVPGGTLLVRKTAFESFKYNESYILEDLDFYLHFAARNQIGFLDEMVSAYRVHGNNTCMSEENWSKSQKDMINSLLGNMGRYGLLNKLRILRKVAYLSILLLRRRLGQLLQGRLKTN